ncbi:hypothetical protein Tco_1521634, partial [Tanacetum coccineum]
NAPGHYSAGTHFGGVTDWYLEPGPLLEAYESELEAPLSPVHAPKHPEYLAPADDDIAPVEDEPLLASPITLSPDYSANSELAEEDPEEEPSEEEEEERSAPADSPSAGLYIDQPSEVEEDEVSSTPPPTSPQTIIPLSHTRLCRARISVRPHTPPSPSTKARIAEYASAPTPPSPPPSPLSQLSSPLPLIPAPPLLLPSHTYMDIIPEADMPLQKRVRFTDPSHRFEIEESSVAAAARQTVPALTRGVDYGFIDIVDASLQATDDRLTTAIEGVNERMTDLAVTYRHDSKEFYTRHQDAQDDRALLQACISTLAWAHSEGRSQAMEAQIRALHAEVKVLRQRIDDGDRLTSHIQHQHDKFRELEHTRDA